MKRNLFKIFIFLTLLRNCYFQNPDTTSCPNYINNQNEVIVIDDWKKATNVQFSYISVDHGGRVIGLTNTDVIWSKNGGVNDPWQKIPGLLKQISIRNGQITGCNANDQIYYKASIYENWRSIDGSKKYVVIDEFGAFIGSNTSYDVYYRANVDAKWVKENIKLKQVDMSMGRVIGITGDDDIYYKENRQGSWVQIPGKMKFVSITERGIICAINSNGEIFLKPSPLKGDFKKIQGILRQIDCKGNTAWGVSQYGDIFRLEFQ